MGFETWFDQALAAAHEAPFAVVVAVEVLEHIPLDRYDSVIEQLWQRTAPNGRFVISVPTTNRPVQEKHERHFTAESLAASLEPRFRIVSTEYVHSVKRSLATLTRLVANRYVVVTSRRVNAPVTALYQRLDRATNARDGAHLIAVCERLGA